MSVALAWEGRQRIEFHETKLIASLTIYHSLTQIVVLLKITFCAIFRVFQNRVTYIYMKIIEKRERVKLILDYNSCTVMMMFTYTSNKFPPKPKSCMKAFETHIPFSIYICMYCNRYNGTMVHWYNGTLVQCLLTSVSVRLHGSAGGAQESDIAAVK